MFVSRFYGKGCQNSRRGFTLIELLIVVAIIAILAAIAVPNFLEAQTRAKISRVKADMQSMTTALESYKIDNNKYPHCRWPEAGYYTHIGYPHPTNRRSHLFRELTTPIAYIATLPRSPFHGKNWIDNASGHYQGHARDGEPGFVKRWIDVEYHSMFGGIESKLWWLGDVGPNLQWDNTPRGGGSKQVPYDPTNGTISMGNIYRFGP